MHSVHTWLTASVEQMHTAVCSQSADVACLHPCEIPPDSDLFAEIELLWHSMRTPSAIASDCTHHKQYFCSGLLCTKPDWSYRAGQLGCSHVRAVSGNPSVGSIRLSIGSANECEMSNDAVASWERTNQFVLKSCSWLMQFTLL